MGPGGKFDGGGGSLGTEMKETHLKRGQFHSTAALIISEANNSASDPCLSLSSRPPRLASSVFQRGLDPITPSCDEQWIIHLSSLNQWQVYHVSPLTDPR